MADDGVEHLEKYGPGVVLAESFGGAVALTLALRRPDLIRRLVLINTFAYYPWRLLIRLAAWFGPRMPARPGHPATRGVRGFFLFDSSIPAPERSAWWERTANVPLRGFGYRSCLIAALDLRRQLPRISVPVLVLAAPNDKVVPARAGIELVRLLPNAHLLRLRVGHAALIHPTVNIARFLANPAYWPSSGSSVKATA